MKNKFYKNMRNTLEFWTFRSSISILKFNKVHGANFFESSECAQLFDQNSEHGEMSWCAVREHSYINTHWLWFGIFLFYSEFKFEDQQSVNNGLGEIMLWSSNYGSRFKQDEAALAPPDRQSTNTLCSIWFRSLWLNWVLCPSKK